MLFINGGGAVRFAAFLDPHNAFILEGDAMKWRPAHCAGHASHQRLRLNVPVPRVLKVRYGRYPCCDVFDASEVSALSIELTLLHNRHSDDDRKDALRHHGIRVDRGFEGRHIPPPLAGRCNRRRYYSKQGEF